ncbi:MAG TPA: transcriptional regulator [Acholeplasma sp.]|nr:transcriptional regulator [Acholeplasma sp.]
MKLVIAIVNKDDEKKVQKALVENRFFATKLATAGTFLRAGNATFLVGVNDEKVQDIIDIIEKHSKKRTKLVPNTIVNEFGSFSSLPLEVEVGGATVFIVNVDQFIKI